MNSSNAMLVVTKPNRYMSVTDNIENADENTGDVCGMGTVMFSNPLVGGGAGVGAGVGAAGVGAGVGALVGAGVGAAVGALVGAGVGALVDAGVGTAVGLTGAKMYGQELALLVVPGPL